MKKLHLILAALCLFASTSFGQNADVQRINTTIASKPLGIAPSASPTGLLDFSKVRFSSSYSMSYLSGGGESMSQGLLSSTMYYDFSSKLSMSLNVGVLHNTGSLFNTSLNSKSSVLPGMSLDYHPSDKFRMSLSVQSFSGLYSPYNGRGYFGTVSPSWLEY